MASIYQRNFKFISQNRVLRSSYIFNFIFKFEKSTDASFVDPKRISIKQTSPSILPDRYIGQPSWKSHPNLMKKDETTPGISKNEYARRREDFMKKLTSTPTTNKSNEQQTNNLFSSMGELNHLVILQAASVTFSAPDVPNPFRQDSNFFYLTGFQEPESILILYNEDPSSSSSSSSRGHCRSALFIAQRNEHKELWEGPRAGLDGASALTGVDYVYEKRELAQFLQRHCAGRRFVLWRDPKRQPISLSFPMNLLSSTSTSGVQNEKTPQQQPPIQMDLDQFLGQFLLGTSSLNPLPALHELRWIKSESELALLRRAGRIGGESLKETIRFSSPNIRENVLAGKMDFECRLRGANGLAYPPVVAGGARANIIHYLNNDQEITEKENLVLMDAGCDFYGYVSDITRTWPVTGRFTDPQRILYEIVYNCQKELLNYVATIRPLTLRDIFLYMLKLLAYGIREAGILKRTTEKIDDDEEELDLRQADRFCPHHVSHYLGMDVHDADMVAKHIDLKPGVVITIEPGLYIKPDDQTVKEEFRGYGIRIEDDVLITETGAEILSDSCPKSVQEIEQLMKSKS